MSTQGFPNPSGPSQTARSLDPTLRELMTEGDLDLGYDTTLDLFDDVSELQYKSQCYRLELDRFGFLGAVATFGVRMELRSRAGDVANLASVLLQLAGREIRWRKDIATSATELLFQCAKSLHRDFEFEAVSAECYQRREKEHCNQVRSGKPPVGRICLASSKQPKFYGAGLFWEGCKRVSACLSECFAQAEVQGSSRAFEPFVASLICGQKTLSEHDIKLITRITDETCPGESWCADVYKKVVRTWPATLSVFLEDDSEIEMDERVSELAGFIDSHLPPETLLDEIVQLLQIEFANAARIRLQRGQSFSVERKGDTSAAGSLAEGASPQGEDVIQTSQGKKTSSSKPHLQLCAIGLEHGGRWHVFRKRHHEWQDQGLFAEVSRGVQRKLLRTFAAGGGFLSKQEAIKTIRSNYSPSDVDPIMDKTVKPALSRIRNAIRRKFGLTKDVDPLPFDDTAMGWRAAIEIGYAVQEDRDHIGGEQRLRFKTHEGLSGDERGDS